MQVTTWAAFPILLTHFILCLTLLFPPAISVPATLLFFIAAFFSFYYSSLCCQTDPIDDKLYRYLHPNERAPDQKKSCKSCIYHIPHPLEIKKDRKNSNPTVTRLCQNGNDQGSHGDDASRNDSEMASVSQKKIFVTSPRKLMQRSKQPSPNGEFSNQNETPDKKSSKAGNTLLALTRMSREKKQSESNFKDETQYNFDGTSCNETNDPQQSEEEDNFVGYARRKCICTPCIVNFVTNAFPNLTIIACGSIHVLGSETMSSSSRQWYPHSSSF